MTLRKLLTDQGFNFLISNTIFLKQRQIATQKTWQIFSKCDLSRSKSCKPVQASAPSTKYTALAL